MKLDIDDLRTIKAIADHGGITRAADALFLTQSAVSHKIKRLEEALEAPLLIRRPGRVELSEDGQRLLGYADKILSLHQEALLSVGRQALSGKIRLGLTEDTTSSGLAHILGRFSRLFPNVQIQSHVDQSMVLEKQLQSGLIDVAIMQVFAQERQSNDILLREDELVWAQGRDFDVTDQKPLPFIAFDRDCFYRQWAENRTDFPSFNVVLECNSVHGVTSAVEAGLGLSILSRRYLSPLMMEITDLYPPLPHIAYVIRKRETKLNAALDALVQAIENQSLEDPNQPLLH